MYRRRIEFWEHEYLEQIYYLLTIDKEKMLDGFNTKEDIRGDWEMFLGEKTSDFATGSERIFYWLFNQFGQPNSSPIGSDMFFETYNAFVHIDVKTVRTSNIDDINHDIFVGDNQNSYIGTIHVNKSEERPYKGNLPTFYTKANGMEKVCLTYFIAILYNEENLNIQTIFITCMPNGELSEIYEPNIPLKAGKNKGKIRFKYPKCKYFELLNSKPLRTKVLIWTPENEEIEKKMSDLKEIYEEQLKIDEFE